MSTVGNAAEPFVILAAWHCDPCDVQGRSLVDDGVSCWNCGGDVTVTARPAIPSEDIGPLSAFHIPSQRTEVQHTEVQRADVQRIGDEAAAA